MAGVPRRPGCQADWIPRKATACGRMRRPVSGEVGIYNALGGTADDRADSINDQIDQVNFLLGRN